MKRALLLMSVVALTAAPTGFQVTAAVNRDAKRGQAIYTEHCVQCHGESGQGDGPASFLLAPRPRDFTAGKFKLRTTETGTLPTDADLIRSVSQGLYGTSMPAWQSLLADADIADVVSYVKSFSPRFGSETPQPVAVVDRPATTKESVVRGAGVYETLQCGKCHGTDGRGAAAVAHEFEDDWQQPIVAADLTEPWTFRGGAAAADVYMRFRTGMSGTPMPSFKEAATDGEMWDLANYVVSIARKPVWEMSAGEVSAFYARQDAEARANPVRRGRYLADTLGCALCHSALDEKKRLIPGMKWAGGLRIRIEPYGEYPTGNLTSDKDTGLGAWTDEQIRAVMTRGTLPDGTRLLPFPMDWPSFSTLESADLNAIVAYLRTIPPVRNKVPRPSRTFLPVYLWGKFKMLVLGQDPPMLFYTGNAGTR
jgi:mono/diheme cytochrome c family protein